MRKLAFLTAAFVGLAVPSFAGVVYSGSDTACFNKNNSSGCTLSSGQTSIGTNDVLAYTPGTFTNVPAGQVALGSFAVSDPAKSMASGTFDMDVTFTAPPNSGSQSFDASVQASIMSHTGSVSITFDNPTTHMFTYPGGGFELSLPTNEIVINTNSSGTLYGIITATPEPSLLLLLGLASAALMFVSKTGSRLDAR